MSIAIFYFVIVAVGDFAVLQPLPLPLLLWLMLLFRTSDISMVINKHLHGNTAPDCKIAFCFKSFGAFIFIMAFCDFLHLLQIINLERFLTTSSSVANALTLIIRTLFSALCYMCACAWACACK